MNVFKLLTNFDVKPEGLDTFISRRDAFAKLAGLGKKTAMAAIPFGAAATLSTKAAANPASTMSLAEVLNFALTLEYLEAEFYTMGLDADGLIPAGKDHAIIHLIKLHEVQHVDLLKTVVESLNATPVEKPAFDFTVGGAFNPFGDYQQFLALAQAFEDTGVRAYKGQAGNLMKNNDLLTAALQIHSVEARHASEIRRLRGLKGWITQDQRGMGMPAETQAVYNGEDNLIQAGVDVSDTTSVGPDGITESYDEPLTKDEVLTIA
ncbi:MAG: ferritin-like domain-containing protein, partial [Cyclobacteriaceae bacterium]